jgi:hypothetical protein
LYRREAREGEEGERNTSGEETITEGRRSPVRRLEASHPTLPPLCRFARETMLIKLTLILNLIMK